MVRLGVGTVSEMSRRWHPRVPPTLALVHYPGHHLQASVHSAMPHVLHAALQTETLFAFTDVAVLNHLITT